MQHYSSAPPSVLVADVNDLRKGEQLLQDEVVADVRLHVVVTAHAPQQPAHKHSDVTNLSRD